MRVKKNMGGFEDVSKNRQGKYVQKMWDKISKNI